MKMSKSGIVHPVWEYKTASWLGADVKEDMLPSDPAPETLARLGAEGWELVSVCVQFNKHFAYFKRQKV